MCMSRSIGSCAISRAQHSSDMALSSRLASKARWPSSTNANGRCERRCVMSDEDRLKYLRIALLLVGVIFLGGIYPLMMLWPAGWTWHTGHSDYPLMIVGIYATLGGFLIMAARNPLENLSLIWFTVWSSVVHAAIMAVQSFEAPENHGHLI